jgi:hypothetical protein
VEAAIKVERMTPDWLAVGLSFGKRKYETGSKSHIMVTSNGWMSTLGTLAETGISYNVKDVVRVRVDSNLQLAEFSCNCERQVVPVELRWEQDIFVCCSLFYKGDCVQVLGD